MSRDPLEKLTLMPPISQSLKAASCGVPGERLGAAREGWQPGMPILLLCNGISLGIFPGHSLGKCCCY